MFRTKIPFDQSYDFKALLPFYRFHQIPNVELIGEDYYTRSFFFENCPGVWTASELPESSEIEITIEHPSANLNLIVARISSMLSLDQSQESIAQRFEVATLMGPLYRKFRGARLPFAWDFFEAGIVTILSQLVSSRASRKLLGCLVETLGEPIVVSGEKLRLFPTSEQVLRSDLKFLGTTAIRKKTLHAFAEAYEDHLESKLAAMNLSDKLEKLRSIYGFGHWTTQYFAIRGCQSLDSFPATDLVLKRHSSPEILAEIETLSPYRSYAAILLWLEHAWPS